MGTLVALGMLVSTARVLASSTLLLSSLLAASSPGSAFAAASPSRDDDDEEVVIERPPGVHDAAGASGRSQASPAGGSIERSTDRQLDVRQGEQSLARRPRARAEAPAADPPQTAPPRGRGVVSAVSAVAPATKPPPAPAAQEPPAAGAVRTRVDLPLEVEVHGQMFFGVSADARQGWDRDVALDRARIEVRGRLPGMLTVIEADVSSKNPLKDAFVRLDGPATSRVTAGRFKAPFLERETESAWSLPLVNRGVVDDYVVDRNDLGGRRLGALGAMRPWAGALEVAGGIFQGTAAGGERPREDYVARVAARPWRPLEAGVSGYRAGVADGPSRRAGSGFVVLRLGPLTGTFEALAGRIAQGPFRAGIGLVEYTQRLSRRVRLTPVAGVEALRLRGDAAGTGSSAVVGAVLGVGSGLKLKVQGERARRPGETAPANAIAVELATRF
jgi:hypothetical protein